MKNAYEIIGDLTLIRINRISGEPLVTTISTSDLQCVARFPNSWCAKWDEGTRSFYCQGKYRLPSGERRTVRLHRWILEAPDNAEVDHIDHNTLDNCRQNLRILTRQQNQQNLKGANKNNMSSGIRGVSWISSKKKWRACVQLNGKKRHIGYFDNVLAAAHAAKEARSILMPYSKDGSI